MNGECSGRTSKVERLSIASFVAQSIRDPNRPRADLVFKCADIGWNYTGRTVSLNEVQVALMVKADIAIETKEKFYSKDETVHRVTCRSVGTIYDILGKDFCVACEESHPGRACQ